MKSRRRQLLVNPEFQRTYLCHALALGLGVSAFYFAVVQTFFWLLASEGHEMGLPPDHVFFAFVSDQRWLMTSIFVGGTIALIALVLFYGFYLSNRIAGPIHRIKLLLRAHREGRAIGTFSSRKGDFFPDLAEEVRLTLEAHSPSASSDRAAGGPL